MSAAHPARPAFPGLACRPGGLSGARLEEGTDTMKSKLWIWAVVLGAAALIMYGSIILRIGG
ncbi:MAG: hypothetical protein EA405_13335 [Rhodospirillales bacterium]|nr:MAG: hypothetical protein EA405_13335 [Rhodospirillales bacterium]